MAQSNQCSLKSSGVSQTDVAEVGVVQNVGETQPTSAGGGPRGKHEEERAASWSKDQPLTDSQQSSFSPVAARN